MCVWVDFMPKEVANFELREIPAPTKVLASLRASGGTDGVEDLNWLVEAERAAGGVATTREIHNGFLTILHGVGEGVTSIYNTINDRELDCPGAAVR